MSKEKFSAWNKSVPNYDEFQDTIAECVAKDTKEELKILELGVGKGGTVVTFLKKYPRCKYFGLDSSEEAVLKCKKILKENSDVKIEIANFSEYETEEKFDVIVAALSIHHLEKENKQKLLNKIKNWLKKDGIFIWGDIVKLENEQMNYKAVKMFNDFRERVLNKEEKQKVKEHIQNDKHIFNTINEMKDMLKESSFETIDIIWCYYRLAIIRCKN